MKQIYSLFSVQHLFWDVENIVIVDWGTAILFNNPPDHWPPVTPEYKPPERRNSLMTPNSLPIEHLPKVDVWAVAIIMGYILFGLLEEETRWSIWACEEVSIN